MAGDLFIISGPSGSGKTSLANRVVAELNDIRFSVSFTTRPPRGQELAGTDYHFIDETQFQRMIADSKFMEWENVYGSYYGTAEAPVNGALAGNQDVLLDIDVKGARKVKALRPEAILIFVMSPTFQELETRLRGRGVNGEAEILNRLRIARDEIKDYKMYDYLIVNRDIEDSVSRLKAIVLAARSRISRLTSVGQEILKTFGD